MITNNILGAIWSKLCISSTYSISGISGLTVGEYMKFKKGRELFLDVYSETVDVSKAQNIKLEKLIYLRIPTFLKRLLSCFLLNKVVKGLRM